MPNSHNVQMLIRIKLPAPRDRMHATLIPQPQMEQLQHLAPLIHVLLRHLDHHAKLFHLGIYQLIRFVF